jgi:hypothetical protein
MPRPVALLDVDHTLLFHDNAEDPMRQDPNETLKKALNITLTNELKKDLKKKKQEGIKDLYLLTDMTFNPAGVADRLRLIKLLEAEHFTVHGVITPADLVWEQLPDDQALSFDKRINGGDGLPPDYREKLSGEPFNTYIDSIEITAIPILKDPKLYSPEHNTPGASFEAAKEAYNADPTANQLPDNIAKKSFVAKALADNHTATRHKPAYSHTKALLVDLFLRKKPEWVSSIVVADDNPDVIKCLKEYKENTKTAVPITTIHVTSKDTKAEVYRDILNKHLSEDPLAHKLTQPAKNESTQSGDGFFAGIKNLATRIKNYAKENPKTAIAIGIVVALGLAAIAVGIAFSGGALAVPVVAATAAAGMGTLFGGVSAGMAVGATGIVVGAAATGAAIFYANKDMNRYERRKDLQQRIQQNQATSTSQTPTQPGVDKQKNADSVDIVKVVTPEITPTFHHQEQKTSWVKGSTNHLFDHPTHDAPTHKNTDVDTEVDDTDDTEDSKQKNCNHH